MQVGLDHHGLGRDGPSLHTNLEKTRIPVGRHAVTTRRPDRLAAQPASRSAFYLSTGPRRRCDEQHTYQSRKNMHSR